MFKPHILVVSDVMNLRVSIAKILGHAGYRVETATINTAAEQLTYKQFQLLFLDLRTPYQEGMKLLSFVRYRHTLMHTIVISSIDSFDFREKAIRNGAEDYLLKPIDPGKIIQTCNSILTPSFR